MSTVAVGSGGEVGVGEGVSVGRGIAVVGRLVGRSGVLSEGWKGVGVGEAFGAMVIRTKGYGAAVGAEAAPQAHRIKTKDERKRVRRDDFIY
jgi:hypothetical protein